MATELIGPELAQGLARAARIVECALGPVGLSLPQYRVLAFLARGPAAAARLAERLTVSRPTLTGVVDGLVAQGLVERTRDDADRRRVHHSLTVRGRTALAAADSAVSERVRGLLDLLPARRRATAAAGLGALCEALDLDRDRRFGPS